MPEELFKENIEIEFDKAIENINNFYKECYNNLSDDEAKKIFMIGSKPKQVGSIIVFLYDIWNFLNIYCSSSKQIELSEGIIKSFSDIKTHLQTVRDKAIRTYTLGRTNRDTSNTVSVDEGNELDNFQKSTTEKRGKLDFKIEDDDDEKTKKLKNELLKNERLICYNKDDDINKNTIKYYNQWKDKNGNIVYTNTKAENATVVNNKAFYTFEGEETDDKNKLINSSDKFIFLLDKIEKTLAENGNEKINYFDKELKKYFYEELLERYRTVNIDEDFKVNIRYGKRSKKNMDQIIPALYNRLNGKAGILNNPRIIENSRVWIQQKEDKPIECMFTNSKFFTSANSCGVIRFKNTRSSEVVIPTGPQYNGYDYPFTAHGFTSGSNGRLGVPEWHFQSRIDIQEGTEIWEIFNDGTEELRAIYRSGKFVIIK